MGKLSNMLYMIDLLNTGNIYTVKSLSEKIGVTERMVRYYKDEINRNGILIETFKGPQGGYFMLDKIKNYMYVNKYDIQLLNNIYMILKNNNYIYLKKYEEFIDKAKKINSINDEKSKFIANNDLEIRLKTKKAKIIMKAIKTKAKIKIIYNDISGNKSQRVIHPLQFFSFKNDLYVIAFCELRNDIRQFEVNRIHSIL